jgi:rod shape-determining protein MreD
MIKKIIFLFLLFYVLILVQTSFLAHFTFKGTTLNLVLLTTIFISLFVREQWFAIASAFIAGLYLDVFSLGLTSFFGFYTLISVGLSLFIRLVIRKYVQIPIKRIQKQKNPLYL